MSPEPEDLSRQAFFEMMLAWKDLPMGKPHIWVHEADAAAWAKDCGFDSAEDFLEQARKDPNVTILEGE